jgi:hypothetical protein
MNDYEDEGLMINDGVNMSAVPSTDGQDQETSQGGTNSFIYSY